MKLSREMAYFVTYCQVSKTPWDGITHDVAKIGVDGRLNETGNDSNGVERAFGKVPVHPVGNVKTTVEAESCKVMGSDGLCFACSLEHEQLRQDSYALQPD